MSSRQPPIGGGGGGESPALQWPGAAALNAGKSALLRQRRPRPLPSPCKRKEGGGGRRRRRGKKRKALVFIHNFFFFFLFPLLFLPLRQRRAPRLAPLGAQRAPRRRPPGERRDGTGRDGTWGGIGEAWGGSADRRWRHCRLCLPRVQQHEVLSSSLLYVILFYWPGLGSGG